MKTELYLMVRSKDAATVMFAVVDDAGTPGIVGEFPKQDTPKNTVLALAAVLHDLFGIAITGEARKVTRTPGGNAWLN